MLQERKYVAAGLALGILAGCSTTQLEQAALPDALNVTSVVVDASGISGITGRNISRSSEQIASDIKAAVTRVLATSSDPAGTPVLVELAVTEVKLANAVDRAVAQASFIRADLDVKRSSDGATLVPGQEVLGTSEGPRLAGTLGVLSTPEADKDYSETVAGFASTMQTLLFGQQ